ncbi:Oidioi.mRNA.OKI2018_I69.chr1.g2721.t1.cds [Oikopleura dioica]|uniref:Oidioi.mRNA.OKI2018_I69.chr1.g2721.t1.cds n=1 Tax=Oikopleura dioica TaxID=34765 RepID=A0ABN7SW67_OIKDI|nr:Oidioi.mRNA.OKI2018_I69.chr1.g2721.t1.cds [Oikopleura dioica]
MGWKSIALWLHLANSWTLTTEKISENELYDQDSGEYIKIFSSKGADQYKISGVDSGPFYVESRRDETLCSDNVCGILWLKRGIRLDREEKDSYKVTLTALDRNGNQVEEDTLTIEVLDENDNAPIFTAASSKLQCDESTRTGGSCGKVEAIDADAGNAGEVEYRLLPNQETWKRRGGDLETKSMGIFNINSETGEITLNNPGPSYWDAESYEFVEIEDAPGKSARNPPVTEKITIYIKDVNDNPPRIVDYEKVIKVGELKPVGSAIGTENFGGKYSFRATDADVDPENNRVTFRLKSESSPFEIVNKDDNTAFLQIAKPGLDFETQKRWTIEVVAENEDAADRGKDANFAITIDVLDENEPPIWDDTNIIFKEGDTNGAKSLRDNPRAKDLDFGGKSPVTYRITKDPLGFFDVDRNSGTLTYVHAAPLDRECESPACNYRNGTYALELEACDDENLCAKKTHYIFIEDINDEGPRIEYNEPVCNILDSGSYVVIKGSTDLKAIDRDDCKKDHCGPFNIKIVGQYSKKFDLYKKDDDTYQLRYIPQKSLPVGETMHIQVSGTDHEGNKQDSVITLNVCRCKSAFDEADCGFDEAIAAGGGVVGPFLAIVMAVIVITSIVVLLIFIKMRRQPEKADALIDDVDDERANIMAYHHEGGGEEDQTDYDPESLVRAKHQKNSLMKTRPVKPSLLGPGIPPEDIGQYINAAKGQADEDPSSPPYDSLLTFDYEGGNSICGDLSEIASNASDYDDDMNLDNWSSPKFRKLADLYAGRENDAYDG